MRATKPAVFIASSAESLELAHALQENLERVAEVTVWTQGVFELSRFAIESLVDALETSDFGVFVFAPDDVSIIRGDERSVVRDNVIFELGLFVGRLGRERNFIVIPRGHESDFHLPSDLLGLTPAMYDPNRQDGNLVAALGPASTKILRSVSSNGIWAKPPDAEALHPPSVVAAEYSDADKRAILESWMGSRGSSENTKVIHFAEVDKALKLPAGTTKQFLKEVATRWRYVPAHEGDLTILFRQEPRPKVSRKPREIW